MGGGGGMGRGGAGGGMGSEGGAPAMPTVTVQIRWVSALPVRQALLKAKLGKEAETSPEAQKLLSEPDTHYRLALIGFPARMAQMGNERLQAELKASTSLKRKGKDPITPEAIQFAGNEESLAVIFAFPKTAPIALDDKEIEFASKVGPLEFKRKFRLKDMVYKGGLAL
ncbi:MAG: hypothetical protein HYR60_19720 [Acidobacteria bacterium]|nr:hypothetical protein [Acidobacteriota bacterium]